MSVYSEGHVNKMFFSAYLDFKIAIYQMFVYLKIHVLKLIPQCDGIQKWNFWDRIGSRGQPSLKKLMLILKETLKNSLTVSFMWGHSEMAISGPGIWSSSDTNLPVPWLWAFWSLELWELILLFKPPWSMVFFGIAL